MNELLGRIRVLWDGLAPRERILVGAAGAAFAFAVLVLGVILPVRGAVDHAREAAENADQALVQMQRMKREWDDLHGRLGSVETRIQSGGEDQNLLTLLESLAARAGVKPSSMEKRQSGESARAPVVVPFLDGEGLRCDADEVLLGEEADSQLAVGPNR